MKINKNKARVELKEAINEAFESGELSDRETYIGEETIDLMVESALNVLFAVEEIQLFMKREKFT